MMNKKNTNGWILCPSKSFPGKFYYFNVINGEAAWCLTEADKKIINKETGIRKVVDKTHSYPEPNTPPSEEPSDNTNAYYHYTSPPSFPLNYHLPPQQIFGQPVFPKYIPHEYGMGYMWPMTPMFVNQPTNKPEKKRLFDQITQTNDIEQEVLVQCSTIPLSKRFGSYSEGKEHTKTFGSEGTSQTSNWWNTQVQNKNVIGTTQGNIFGSKNNKFNVTKTPNSIFGPIINEKKTANEKIIKESFFTTNDYSDTVVDKNHCSNKKPNLCGQKSTLIAGSRVENTIFCKPNIVKIDDTIKKSDVKCLPTNNTWIQPSKSNIAVQKSTVSPGNKVDIASSNETNDIKLNSNDLRLVLQAKRRKIQHCGIEEALQVNDTPLQSSDFDTENGESANVAYNTESLKEEIISIEETATQDSTNNMTEMESSQVLNISYLRSLAKPCLKTDPWYIVVDMGVLLDNFDYIDEFVQEDITCRLLVPNAVRTYIQTISVGEYAGLSRVMLARKAVRRLSMPGQHVILQPPIMDNSSSSAIDAIIECCMQVQQQHHTILVTTGAELYSKAIATGIHTYKIKDIKTSTENQKITFDLKKINITVSNDNIFRQNTDNFRPFARSNNNVLPANDTVFKVPTTIIKNNLTQKKNKIDASTSPVIFDKLMDITKTRQTLHATKMFEKSNDSSTDGDSNIDENIQNLSITENMNESSNKSAGTQQRKYRKFKFRKVIVNPNCIIKDGDKKDGIQNVEPVKKKIVLNRNFHLRKSALENVSNMFLCKSGNPQNTSTENSAVETQTFQNSAVLSQNIKGTVEPQTTNSSVETQTKNKVILRRLNVVPQIPEEMQRFLIKDVIVKRRIESRLEEWLCCYVQIMEDCLNYLLMNNNNSTKKTLNPPWNLHEAVICIKEIYLSNSDIKTVAEKLSNILISVSDKNGKLQKIIRAQDFMQMFGHGVCLLESLNKVLHCKQVRVRESIELLNNLLQQVQDPSTDSELPTNLTPVRNCEMEDITHKNLSPKEPSEIIQYLKKYFPAWKDYEEEQPISDLPKDKPENIQDHGSKVIQTNGKNLNNIVINNAKQITFENVLQNTQLKENVQVSREKEKLTQNIDKECKENINKTPLNNNYIDKYVNENKVGDNIKIIREANLIEDYEARILKNNTSLFHVLNFSENGSSKCFNVFNKNSNFFDFGQIAQTNENFASDESIGNNDNAILFSDDRSFRQNEESLSLFDVFNDNAHDNDNNNDTKDSGIENECLQACAFTKTFLNEMSATFKIIYGFIEKFIQDFRSEKIRDDEKKKIYDQANETHLHVADIIGKLKLIIERESAEQTMLKSLIISAGEEALTDKRMTRYRQVVMKCAEQAQLLENALKTTLALTNHHCDVSAVDLNKNACDIRYFNIFE